MKEKLDQRDFIDMRNVCSVEDIVERMRGQATDREKIAVKSHLTKDCYPTCTRSLSLNKKTNSPIKTWAKYLNRQLTEEDLQRTNEHVNRCSTSYGTRETHENSSEIPRPSHSNGQSRGH